MIEINTTYTCDRCNKDIPEGSDFFKIKKEKISTVKRVEYATVHPLQLCGDGIQYSFYGDQHKAYHTCKSCSDSLIRFMEEYNDTRG